MKFLLGIDLGTSATKTVLFDLSGVAIASSAVEYPMYQPQNGWAEQDADDWIDAAFRTTRAVIEESGINSSEIAGIGISGQMHGLVMLDENNIPLRRSIIWCDQRTAAECDEIHERVGKERLIEITANPALTGFMASKILWVRNNEPEIYAKCRHILLPKDYLRFRLTGEYATEVSDASGMQLLDVPNRCWSDEVLQALEIDKALLGKVYESVEITGYITEEAAAQTGLAVGIPVVGGAGDNAAAAVGTGVVTDGSAFTTIGTSGVVYAHTDNLLIDKKGRAHTFCCAVPGAWHVMGVTQAAGLSLQWFRDSFCSVEMEEAAKRGVSPYVVMDEKAAEVPIGSNRLIYLPYLMGERTPHLDPDCRGVFFGLSAIHQRPYLIRAVMEGVTYSLKDCFDVLREMGVSFSEMYACGGGGTSSLWRQMMADVYGCPVRTVKSKEGPALGVAILAAVGTGLYPDVKTACDAMIEANPKQEPNPENTQKYASYHKLFRNLYVSLKDDYKKLAKI